VELRSQHGYIAPSLIVGWAGLGVHTAPCGFLIHSVSRLQPTFSRQGNAKKIYKSNTVLDSWSMLHRWKFMESQVGRAIFLPSISFLTPEKLTETRP
jgi:hypothetical protein